MSNELAMRYNVGSNAGPQFGVQAPGSPEAQFFIGMPRSVEEVVRLGGNLVAGQGRALDKLRSIDNHAQNNLYALNEIANQVQAIDSTFRQGFGDMTVAIEDGFDALDNTLERGFEQIEVALNRGFNTMAEAIFFLEASTSAHLSEIKTALGQVDDKLARLVHLASFPRGTEARELIGQGTLALATGNIDDAEAIFCEALIKDRTNFQANTNMAFVMLHTGDAEGAISYSKKALDYAPKSKSGESVIFAARNLARTYFASEMFIEARKAMATALSLQKGESPEKNQNIYQFAVYSALSGEHDEAIDMLCNICQKEPKYFAIVAADADLRCIQDPLITTLNNMAAQMHHSATERWASVKSAFSGSQASVGFFDEGEALKGKISENLINAEALLAREDYSGSAEALTISEDINKDINRLNKHWTRYLALHESTKRMFEETSRRAKELVDPLKGLVDIEKTISIVSYRSIARDRSIRFDVKTVLERDFNRVEMLLTQRSLKSLKNAEMLMGRLNEAFEQIPKFVSLRVSLDLHTRCHDALTDKIDALETRIADLWATPDKAAINITFSWMPTWLKKITVRLRGKPNRSRLPGKWSDEEIERFAHWTYKEIFALYSIREDLMNERDRLEHIRIMDHVHHIEAELIQLSYEKIIIKQGFHS